VPRPVRDGEAVIASSRHRHLAGSQIDQYPSFDEYFLAMTDHNRSGIANLHGSAG